MVIFKIDPDEVQTFQPELGAYYRAQSNLFAKIVFERRLAKARKTNLADTVFDLMENTVSEGVGLLDRFGRFAVEKAMKALSANWQKTKRTRLNKAILWPRIALGKTSLWLSEVFQSMGNRLLKIKTKR